MTLFPHKLFTTDLLNRPVQVNVLDPSYPYTKAPYYQCSSVPHQRSYTVNNYHQSSFDTGQCPHSIIFGNSWFSYTIVGVPIAIVISCCMVIYPTVEQKYQLVLAMLSQDRPFSSPVPCLLHYTSVD